jgi:hypothetical protein
MNLLDSINNNMFLKTLFPEGLTEKILIGQIAFDVEGRFSINLHTMQKPSIEVKKWGSYGRDYDVIVIKLLGSNVSAFSVTHWREVSYSDICLIKTDTLLELSAAEENWAVHAVFETLGFQECSTYLS